MKTLLYSLGATDLDDPTIIRFDTNSVHPHLPYHVVVQVRVECLKNTFKCIVINECATTSMMSLACWKCLSSLMLSKSMTMLTSFYGLTFRLHGTIPSLQVQLGGNTMAVKDEVVDAPIDYTFLLG